MASLTRATADVKEQTRQYAAVPHRKDKEKRPFGTGIVWATSLIRPGMAPEKISKVADLKIEQKKVAAVPAKQKSPRDGNETARSVDWPRRAALNVAFLVCT